MIYIAAPLFNEAEREFNVRIKRSLARFTRVFLPQEDGDLMSNLSLVMDREAAAKRIFDGDVSAIRSSKLVVAVLDGRAIDEGVCVELGIASAYKVPCVGIKTDSRQLDGFGDNPMVSGCLNDKVRNLEELEILVRKFFG